ncbi:hypothetical protein RhiirA4_457969 [Rhizophagus irregularis]|uniref:Uncharacterized protein n=1 Tax=Rhizophagus irregularis TaxID=588596 RepID=A0A2I1GB69_9GLOM|nr:hypothetical protein RhiirA4_457969 [Rhizophagus irregularis]
MSHLAIKWAGYNNAYHIRSSKVTQKLLESDEKVPETGKELKHMTGGPAQHPIHAILASLESSQRPLSNDYKIA